ncbi:MAG: hypothetical protein BGO27_02340 [Alphaproteobacteria bacterium 33-17]|nr:MAG: hypothetical protein BGO27_02340 [Alphaproteobacteria bacterium 33-17]
MMNTTFPDKTEQKQSVWQKGGPSPNPSGRPKGSQNKAIMAVQQLLDDEGEGIARKAIELALSGDITAIKCVLERIIPPAKSRPITIDLPEMSSVQDTLLATSKVITEVSQGNLTPQDGLLMMGLLEKFAKTLEVSELEKRISNLEEVYERN